jgi:hypothetical protein
MFRSHRRTSLIALALIGIMIAAALVPPSVASWLSVAALALVVWPVCVDTFSPATITVVHLAFIASCFAAGVHDQQRAEWLTLLATLAVLPLGWAFRRRHRAVKGVAGLVLVVLTIVVYAWSTGRIDHRMLAIQADFLQAGTVGGIVLIVLALRPVKPSLAPAGAEPVPSPEPAGLSQARHETSEDA